MCNPAAAVAVASAVYGAQQQRQQGKFQQGVAEYNARVAENEAEEVRRVGTEAENIKRRETVELLSRQRAQLAANNVELDSGSALQLQEDTVAQGNADALRIRNNTDARFESLQTSANLTTISGQNAATAGSNAAFGTLLSGAGDTVDSGAFDKPADDFTSGNNIPPSQRNRTVSSKWYTPRSGKVIN